MAMATGGVDSGVETGNESNDIDINISPVMDVQIQNNSSLGCNSIVIEEGSSISNITASSSSDMNNVVCSPIGNFLGSRLSVSGSEQSDNDNDVPPPPPPTSPNICGNNMMGHSDFSLQASNTESDGLSLDENISNSDVEFTGLNDGSPTELGSDETTEEMDRDFHEDDEIIDDDRSCDSSSISPPLADTKELYGMGCYGDQSFEFHLSSSRHSPHRNLIGNSHNVFSDSTFFTNGYHNRSMYCQQPPPAPPVTPTNTNTCKALIKFEFPELPKLVCQFVEPPAGLRSYLTIEPFQTDNSSGYNILQGTASTDCRAIIRYDQHDLCQKVRSHTRAIRNKLFDNWSNIRKEQPKYNSTHNERRLRTAAHAGNPQMISKMLKAGVNPNSKDEHGRTALHIAACKGNSEIIRLLLQSGADPNQKDTVGNTPLHLAACTNHCEAVTCLLRAGTDIRTLDNHGRNPLQLAQSKLKLLATCKCDTGDSIKVKMEVQQIIEMMLEYLQKRGQDVEAELLNSFASRLTLSQTPEEVDADVKNLLANLSSLSINSSSSSGPIATTNSLHSSSSSKAATPALRIPSNPYLAYNLNTNLAKSRQSSSFVSSSLSTAAFPSSSNSSSSSSSSSSTNPNLSSSLPTANHLSFANLHSFNESPREEQKQLISNLTSYRDNTKQYM